MKFLHQHIIFTTNTVHWWQITILLYYYYSFKNSNWYQIGGSSEKLWGYTLVTLGTVEENVGLSVLLLFVPICVTVKAISMSDVSFQRNLFVTNNELISLPASCISLAKE